MKAENVAEYLQNNPEFFDLHAELFGNLHIPHPYGGRTISLSERQVLVLRERVRELEKNLHEWMQRARENDALQDKLHLYTLSLMGIYDLPTLKEVCTRNLREIFSVPHAVLHIWHEQAPGDEVLAFVQQQLKPVCTHQPLHDTLSWFGETGVHLHSFAYLPLHQQSQPIGMLVLASEDVQRFYPEMGTVFLQRIAEMLSQAVQARL